jgi:hypothetical protein
LTSNVVGRHVHVGMVSSKLLALITLMVRSQRTDN